jgi:hypothetical protein
MMMIMEIKEMNKLTCVVGSTMLQCMIEWNLLNKRVVQAT